MGAGHDHGTGEISDERPLWWAFRYTLAEKLEHGFVFVTSRCKWSACHDEDGRARDLPPVSGVREVPSAGPVAACHPISMGARSAQRSARICRGIASGSPGGPASDERRNCPKKLDRDVTRRFAL